MVAEDKPSEFSCTMGSRILDYKIAYHSPSISSWGNWIWVDLGVPTSITRDMTDDIELILGLILNLHVIQDITYIHMVIARHNKTKLIIITSIKSKILQTQK